jgi:hypothetical protein
LFTETVILFEPSMSASLYEKRYFDCFSIALNISDMEAFLIDNFMLPVCAEIGIIVNMQQKTTANTRR